MLDPRIESLAEKIKVIEEAVLIIANSLDGVAWRVSSEEERKAGIDIADRIRKKLGKE